MAEPGALTELALDAIAKYFYDLCNRILPNPQSQEEVEIDIETVAPIFKDLHSLLAESVPVDLANKLTNKLLVTLHEWLEIVPCDIRDMTFMLAASVIHPLVTRIEPQLDSLHCSDIFNADIERSYPSLGDFLAMTAQLPNLKALHLRNFYSDNRELVSVTSQLEEFSGAGLDDNVVMKIAKTCKKLKYLDLRYSRHITDNSVDVILNEMKQLEWLNVANTGITSSGMTRLLRGLIEKGDLLKLKYLQITYTSECLELLQMLPSLTLSFQSEHFHGFRIAPKNFHVSDLFVLHNLHGLTIKTTLRELNDLLHKLGSQLVYLDVMIESVESEYFYQGGDFLNMLLIGQYCKKLKCLHISDSYEGKPFPNVRYFPRLPLPGYQTVTCLKVDLGSFFFGRDKTNIENIVYTLASQCVNVKKVTILVDPYFYTRLKLVRNLVQDNCLKITEEVYFKYKCNACEDFEYEELDVHIEGEKFKDEEVVGMLAKHCSKLHTVGGFPWLDRNHHLNTQRLKIKK